MIRYRYRLLAFLIGCVLGFMVLLVVRDAPEPDLCLRAAEMVYLVGTEENEGPPSVRRLYAHCVWEQAINHKGES